MITREFNLYLHAGHSIPLVINVNQYDHGEQWLFTLFNSNGTQYVPSSGAIVGIKSDNLGIINTGSVDAQGRVVINETQQMTAAVGKAVFELLIDDQTHGTANFIVLVEPKPGDQADLSESDLSLIQQAIDGTSATAIAQGVSDWMDENLTPTTPVVDTSLTVQGAAADSAKVGQEISDLKSQIAQGSGLTESVKQALLACFEKVAWSGTTGRTLVDALEDALYPPANLTRISAVYTQGSTVVYDTDTLDSLKANLVVTAYYDNGTSEIVSSYVLSGTLAEGTSVITATYGGKTATFNVTVTEDTEYGTFTPTNVITGSYINTDGSIGTYETSAYSETYYPVKHNVISFGGTGWSLPKAFNVRLCLYNSEKTFLRQLRIRYSSDDSADYHGNPVVIAIPNDAKYFRLSWAEDSAPLPNPEFTITNLAYTDLFMEIGDIDSSTGAEIVNTKRIRSDYITVNSTSLVIQEWIPFLETQSKEYKNAGYFFRCYDSSKTLIDSTSYTSADATLSVPTGTEFVRLLIQFSADDMPSNFDERIYRPFVMNSVNYFIKKASE